MEKPNPMTPRPEGEVNMSDMKLTHSAEKEQAAYAAGPKFLRCQIHRHRTTTELYNVCQAIEACGASPALTAAVMACEPLRTALHDLLDERDALRVSPAPGGAVGEEDRAWLNCELLRFLNCYKSPTPGSLADMALVQGQKEGALRYFFEAVCNRFAERSAAVRRAAEQGRQQVVALIVTANTQAIPHHSADWMNGFAAGQRAMRSAVATGLAALADDEGRGNAKS